MIEFHIGTVIRTEWSREYQNNPGQNVIWSCIYGQNVIRSCIYGQNVIRSCIYGQNVIRSYIYGHAKHSYVIVFVKAKEKLVTLDYGVPDQATDTQIPVVLITKVCL